MTVWVDALGFHLEFETDEGLFSPRGLDRGTRAMLEQTRILPGMRVLDLGCGWGAVGVLAAKIAGEENVVMADCDPLAVEIARENARRNGVAGVRVYQSEGFSGIPEAGFDSILSNPPYQTDFQVAKGFILKGFNRLKLGGEMTLVVKRRDWYANKLTSVFGGVSVREADGYFVMTAQRRSVRYAAKPR